MARQHNEGQQDLITTVGELLRDSGRLVSQQIELLRSEVKQEVRRAAGGALSIAAGGGLAAVGGILSGMMLARLLHATTRLPLWSCYGLVAAGLGAAGAALVKKGQQELADLELLPQTTEAVQENATWLKERMSPAAT
jgi:hypothetical protein